MSDSYRKELEGLIGTESELHYLLTTFATSAMLTTFIFPVMVTSKKFTYTVLWQLLRAC